jgi:hypothetical protein
MNALQEENMYLITFSISSTQIMGLLDSTSIISSNIYFTH